jgi:hypothetical protein
MSEYTEKRTVSQQMPLRSRPVVETQYDSVVHEDRPMSGGAIAALVLAVLAVGVVITMLIVNNQQRNQDDQLAQERARAAAAEQNASQPSQQQPLVVPVPQPTAVPVPYPVPGAAQSAPANSATGTSSAHVERDVISKLLSDRDLRLYSIDVKVTTDGTAVLSGRVPSENLKTRAETLAMIVKGVNGTINNIEVQP